MSIREITVDQMRQMQSLVHNTATGRICSNKL